jgi:hypothetical protein
MRVMKVALCSAAFAVGAAAQTVTGSGTMGSVPVFTGSSTLGNSGITQSGGNVGIGTTNPQDELDLGQGALRWDYLYQPTLYYARSYLNVNGSGNANLTYLSFQVQSWPNTAAVTPLVLTGNGNVGIGTTIPTVPLEVSTTTAGNPSVLKIVRTGGNAPGEGPVLEFDDWADTVPMGHIYTYLTYIGAGNNYDGKLILGSHTGANYNDELTLYGGNVGIGTANPGARLEIDGNVMLTSGSGASITFADGTVQSTAYTGVTCGGDYAESVNVAGVRASYEPGDVLVIGPDSGSDVVESSEPYSTNVAGVYSTKPGVVGRRQTSDPKASKTEVPMAMIGIVPTKVSAENGPIKRGDLLVTSSIPGYAMKGTDRSRLTGAVLGKALGNLDSGTGAIEALITLQ